MLLLFLLCEKACKSNLMSMPLHQVTRPKELYYVLKRPIQNTFYSVIQEDSHTNRRAIIAFRTKEHAQQFKHTYVNTEFEKHSNKKAIAKNIVPKAIDADNLQNLCDLAAMDCVCFAPDLEQSFLITPSQSANHLRAHFEQKYMMRSYYKMKK
jgi:hypothetical protein